MSDPSSGVQSLVIVAAGVFGLLVGSFLNVVIYRAPLGLSVSVPRSFCPTCDRTLSWWENVPVVSWVGLRGRCHTCHEPISIRYPLVELATGVIFVLVAWAWHGNALTAGYCVMAATALAAALIEYGGSRTPLGVGAVGAGIGVVLVVVAALWIGHDRVAAWAAVGLIVGVAAFGCLVVLWVGGRHHVGADAGSTETGAVPVPVPMLPVASVPMVTGIVVAMVVSLIVAG